MSDLIERVEDRLADFTRGQTCNHSIGNAERCRGVGAGVADRRDHQLRLLSDLVVGISVS
jgi:hypothetical protein